MLGLEIGEAVGTGCCDTKGQMPCDVDLDFLDLLQGPDQTAIKRDIVMTKGTAPAGRAGNTHHCGLMINMEQAAMTSIQTAREQRVITTTTVCLSAVYYTMYILSNVTAVTVSRSGGYLKIETLRMSGMSCDCP